MPIRATGSGEAIAWQTSPNRWQREGAKSVGDDGCEGGFVAHAEAVQADDEALGDAMPPGRDQAGKQADADVDQQQVGKREVVAERPNAGCQGRREEQPGRDRAADQVGQLARCPERDHAVADVGPPAAHPLHDQAADASDRDERHDADDQRDEERRDQVPGRATRVDVRVEVEGRLREDEHQDQQQHLYGVPGERVDHAGRHGSGGGHSVALEEADVDRIRAIDEGSARFMNPVASCIMYTGR